MRAGYHEFYDFIISVRPGYHEFYDIILSMRAGYHEFYDFNLKAGGRAFMNFMTL